MRFTLRRMFAAVIVAAIALALLLYLTTSYRRRLAIRSDLQAIGAYSVRFGPSNSIHASFHDPIASASIAKYRKISVLDFKAAHVTAESLDNLAGLETVDAIVFSLSDVRDEHLLQLKEIGQVRHLILSHTKLTDDCIDALIDLPGLESVDVSECLITLRGIERLQNAQPSLIVRDRFQKSKTMVPTP